MIFEVNMIGSNNSSWWVDIGATRHVCADKYIFHSFRAVDNGEKLYMGNSATANIKGEGDVILKLTSEIGSSSRLYDEVIQDKRQQDDNDLQDKSQNQPKEEEEPSYNQNYDDNYYPHESPSFPCCDYYGGSHETYQCQPDNQNINFSGSDQIQTPQYSDVNPPSPEIKYDQSTTTDCPIFLNGDDGHFVQDKESLENPFSEIAVSKPDNESEPEATTDTELLSTEDIQPLAVQEPSQDSDICQLIREDCCISICEEQKQNMEKAMLDLVKSCHHKEFLCMYDNVEDLIEGALDTKLLLINSIKSQRPDKKEQEVKNVEEQLAERSNHAEKSLQNFRVIHKNSISLNSSQISSVHVVAPILSTKEPEHSLSMGYEHLSITPETESDEVMESNAKNLLPIPSEYEVTSEIKNDMPANDDSSQVFITFSNPIFNDDDDLDSSDNESLPEEDVPAEEFKVYSNSLFDNEEINSDKLDPHCFNVESDFVESLLNRETFIDSSSTFDFLLKEFTGELAHINLVLPKVEKADFDFEEDIHFIENLLYDNSSPRPLEDLNAEIADTIIESLPSSSIRVQDNDASEEIDLVTDTDELLPPPFENDNEEEESEASDNLSIPHSFSESPNAKPDQESTNDISNDSTNDPLLEEANVFLASDNSIPPGVKHHGNDSKRDIHFLEALLIDVFIPFSVSESFDFEDDLSIPRPLPKPPDEETNSEVISTVMENIDEPNKDEYFDPGGEIFVSTKDEDVDCFPFI
nr:Pol polyprotein [Tanacetum cinerariifolium]